MTHQLSESNSSDFGCLRIVYTAPVHCLSNVHDVSDICMEFTCVSLNYGIRQEYIWGSGAIDHGILNGDRRRRVMSFTSPPLYPRSDTVPLDERPYGIKSRSERPEEQSCLSPTGNGNYSRSSRQ